MKASVAALLVVAGASGCGGADGAYVACPDTKCSFPMAGAVFCAVEYVSFDEQQVCKRTLQTCVHVDDPSWHYSGDMAISVFCSSVADCDAVLQGWATSCEHGHCMCR